MSPAARRAPARGKRAFAATWWGQAWVRALEDSTLDAGRLSRGRTYARKGMVGDVIVAPGQVKAPVQGSRPRPYRSAVHLPVLTDRQWDTLLDAIAARAGHVAALLDGEMPEDLVEDAGTADVPLLPRPTELDPECSCPDWGHPCKHAAALCYAIAARIDDDPFLLFALRGRTREQIFTALRARRTAASPTPVQPSAGVPATAAYARWIEEQPPLPSRPLPTGPRAPVLPVAPPLTSGLDLEELQRQVADTATRAQQLLHGDPTSLTLTQRQDAIRLAASHGSPEWFHRLQQGTGLRPRELARLTRAWRHGGPMGVTVAEQPTPAAPAVLAAARTALSAALTDMTEQAVPLKAWRGRLTLGDTGIQLRHGPDNRWYPYTREDGEWWPCAPADTDPVAALTTAWEQRTRRSGEKPRMAGKAHTGV
ncbi:SWIM zinc finger family protein [Streptomyces sp. ME19-01-6]|uniref:SWIM zinc finger family protein n=1 Tax=Streptomyces sp. ME19-01-6 TaxID=3028686 RepID=UPI0029A3D8CA|nr:SWIM zinc finger family protein [Streptomyces sp. ME19-01-6]MDX3226244.1 SWIM zinc finger family protein [Streptomyces sp. ME19-01-6]